MKVFAISDLHLSLAARFRKGQENRLTKPMDRFGERWGDYHEKLYDNWHELVGREDYVLMPGDTSWGLKLEECQWDFDYLGQLPGTIILGRGNHDYWWQSLAKLTEALPYNVLPLHHDALAVGSRAVCSTRGWSLPGVGEWSADDEKIYQRELLRLEMALEAARKLGLPPVAMLHYMPLYADGRESAFSQLLAAYGVERCVYGHLHGAQCARAVQGRHGGIDYLNVSCDALDFVPRLLWEE